MKNSGDLIWKGKKPACYIYQNHRSKSHLWREVSQWNSVVGGDSCLCLLLLLRLGAILGPLSYQNWHQNTDLPGKEIKNKSNWDTQIICLYIEIVKCVQCDQKSDNCSKRMQETSLSRASVWKSSLIQFPMWTDV